jgi:cysteinyl-tRNA synthetase
MDDDFNTADAVAVLFDLANNANRTGGAALTGTLKALAGTLGLLQRDPVAFLQGRNLVMTPGAAQVTIAGHAPDLRVDLGAEDIEARIAQRATAKSAKNYTEADRIRAELLALGVVLEDKPGGVTEWRRA